MQAINKSRESADAMQIRVTYINAMTLHAERGYGLAGRRARTFAKQNAQRAFDRPHCQNSLLPRQLIAAGLNRTSQPRERYGCGSSYCAPADAQTYPANSRVPSGPPWGPKANFNKAAQVGATTISAFIRHAPGQINGFPAPPPFFIPRSQKIAPLLGADLPEQRRSSAML